MAVRGFVTQARRNDRLTLLMFGGFMLAVELLGALVLTFFTIMFDPAHTVFVHPLAYLARYFLPVSAAGAFTSVMPTRSATRWAAVSSTGSSSRGCGGLSSSSAPRSESAIRGSRSSRPKCPMLCPAARPERAR